jgi:hypothetical protein
VVERWTFTGRRSLVDLVTGEATAPAGRPAGATTGSEQPLPPGHFRSDRRRLESEHERQRPGHPPTPPSPAAATVTSPVPGFAGFQGLGAADDVLANKLGGEPPDQGLCVGAGRVVEAANDVVTVYGTDGSGRPLLPDGPSGAAVSFNALFGLPPLFADGPPQSFGPDLFDPTCQFDQDVRRFFLTVSGLATDPVTGDLTGRSALYLAVTATADPLGEWATFALDPSAGDRFDRGCPCYDDFPHIGADATGFYISANRFAIAGEDPVNAKIHATAKRALAAAAAAPRPEGPAAVTVTPGPAGGSPTLSVQPAIVPPGAPFAPDLEYFVSATDFSAGFGRRIAVWALSNTTSLDGPGPALRLTHRVVETLPYAEPEPTVQRPGPFPLGRSLGEPLSPLDSGLDEITESPAFAAGRLWTAMTTAVAPGPGGTARTGILWIVIDPSGPAGEAGGRVVAQGYLAVEGDNLLYPAVGVNPQGRGAMVFSLAGPGRFPSAAFVAMGAAGPEGPVRVMGEGVAPEDGDSCYTFGASDPAPCRWGDYSAARVDEQGDVWMGTEYIGPGPRTEFTNWSTFVGRLDDVAS